MSYNRTPLQSPAVRRFSQVYVEIPPSPLHGSRAVSGNTGAQHVRTFSANRKENAPLRPSNMFQTQMQSTSASPSRKRKLSESDTNTAVAAVPSSSMKKQKLVAYVDMSKTTKPSKDGTMVQNIQPSNASEEFPNGYFYCHQCSRKRDSTTGIHCTIKDVHGKRCKIKFCTPCLKNRYGERVDELKAAVKLQDNPTHVRDESYVWKCPRCRDICNCSRCRKAKGLEPTGNLTTVARRAGAESAAVMLSENPATMGILPGKGQQITPAEKKLGVHKPQESSQASSSSNSKKIPAKAKPTIAAGASAKPKPKPKPKPKTLPTLKWAKIPMDGALPLAETESRIQIREFVLRFACIMDSKSISRKMLEELEEISGDNSKSKGRGWDNDDDDEDEEVVGWVSEVCVKGIVIGLLALINRDEKESRERKLTGDAIKALRASGANLTKVWAILASLRESIGQSSGISHAADSLSNLPDPLAAPSSVTYHNTRTTRTANANAVLVAQSSQMVPVLVALTEAALETEVVRAEIDEGVKEGKDKVREGREGIKIENERWEKEKEQEKDPKTKEAKEKRDAHKRTILDLEESLKVAMNAYVPRFSGLLGKDMDGRLYWAVSPSIVERENASQMIAHDVSEGYKEKKHKRTVPDDEERKGMKKWSWFIGVWGKGPVCDGEDRKIKVAEKKKTVQSDEDSESDDADQDCWWGFWEPEEIKKVADWIEIRSGLGDDVEIPKDQVEKGKTVADGSGVDASSTESSPLSAMSDTDNTSADLYAENSSKMELKSLVKGLKEYASLLQWRVRNDVDDKASSRNGSGSGVVAATKFYN